SVVNTVYQSRVYWFWGDTNRPAYPLGNFHVPGATSLLPDQGGLDPERGVDLTYFVDAKGFARPTAPMPGEGPTWIDGLVSLREEAGRERLFAAYVKVRPPLTIYARGLAEFADQAEQQKLIQAGHLKPEQALLQLQDRDTGKPVLAHSGSVYWNAYRRRWVMITVQSRGTSFLGEVWYAEADTPVGPWTYAIKIV